MSDQHAPGVDLRAAPVLIEKNVAMATSGYSGTPLAKKLGIEPGHSVTIIAEPDGFRSLLDDLPDDVDLDAPFETPPDVLIAFFTAREELSSRLAELGGAIHPDRVLWLAWPKKSAKVPSNLSGDVVRGLVLETDHLVDVKVCAISETWSGLKIMWRKDHR